MGEEEEEEKEFRSVRFSRMEMVLKKTLDSSINSCSNIPFNPESIPETFLTNAEKQTIDQVFACILHYFHQNIQTTFSETCEQNQLHAKFIHLEKLIKRNQANQLTHANRTQAMQNKDEDPVEIVTRARLKVKNEEKQRLVKAVAEMREKNEKLSQSLQEKRSQMKADLLSLNSRLDELDNMQKYVKDYSTVA